MSKTPFKKYLLAAAGFLVVAGASALISTAPSALAIEGEDNQPKLIEEKKKKFTEFEKERLKKLKAEQNKRQAKLEGTKLKACQNRENAINNILSKLATKSEKHIGAINAASVRIQTFYADKRLNVSNYNELLTAVTAKKTAAETAVADVKAASVSFKCDGSDPKGAGQAFKDYLRNQNAALKEYKLAVKNLLVAVKTAASAEENQQ